MTERLREVAFAGALVAVAVLGVVVDVVAGGVDRPERTRAGGARFLARAMFCPHSEAAAGSLRVAVSGVDSSPISVGMEPVENTAAELKDEMLLYRATGGVPIEVVGYGGPAPAAALVSATAPVEGAAAMLCSTAAAARWSFASGSSSLDSDERIVLYNPFPDEAVARISFMTPTGDRTPAALEDVAVPAGESVAVTVNETLQTVRSVGATVEAVRGRLVAWRQQFEKESDVGPGGVEATLGAPSTSRRWYFAQGVVGEGVEERISVMNPGPEEAVVQITLTTEDETVTPSGLVELPIPGRSSQTYSLASALRKIAGERVGVSALVRSTNGVAVVAERSIEYSLDDFEGVAAEVGATAPKTGWVAFPAAARARSDSLAVFNPGVGPATVSVSLVGTDGRVAEPTELAGVKVRGRARVSFGLNGFTKGLPMVARVTATAPVVVERTAYAAAGDVATVSGVPIP